MLRFTVRNAILNRFKYLPRIGSNALVRGYSTENANPQEMGETQLETPQNPYTVPIKEEESERLAEFRKKLKEDIAAAEMNRYNLMTPIENDPLPPWPNNVNPHTGEIGGPRGPEPTRYGDWERKGICVDF